MKKASILLAHALLVAGCTLVFAESDPEPSPRTVASAGAGTQRGGQGGTSQSAAGAPGEAGAGTVLPGGGAGGTGGAGEDPAGGQGGALIVGEGLGEACEDASTCPETAPACPAAAGYCTFYCDEAWVNGWREVPLRVQRCEEQGGACTPIGEERSYCEP
jgi:hypothetical protein